MPSIILRRISTPEQCQEATVSDNVSRCWGLWRDYPATSRQAQLSSTPSRRRPTQAQVIVELLRRKRSEGKPLELPEILAAGIAQHSARMKEIRERGFVIRNEMQRNPDGCVLSRYWLECDPEQDGQP
jgi:Helix-turn-helix domain